jgi:hypothetical protein
VLSGCQDFAENINFVVHDNIDDISIQMISRVMRAMAGKAVEAKPNA